MPKKPSSAPLRPTEPPPARRAVLLGLILFLASTVVYYPAVNGSWLWDDDQEITNNGLLRSTEGLYKIWFANPTPDYFPLKSTVQWLVYQIWGENPTAFHLLNLITHGGCVVLLWRVLQRMRVPGAWLAALVWGLHPVNVESVAWISELKNTLSLLFLLPAMLAFMTFEERGRPQALAAAFLFFVAAMLCKTSVVPFPVFLLLWLWWKHGRLTLRHLAVTTPFFLAALVLGIVTIIFQHSTAIGGEILPTGGPFTDVTGTTNPPPLKDYAGRIISACFATGFYFYQTLYPFRLLTIYPQWHITLPPWLQVLPAFGYAALFFFAWKQRATWGRHVILGFGFFLLMLTPVLGIIRMSYLRLTLVADHFNYLPMIGLIALGVGALAAWRNRHGATARAVYVVCGTAVVLLFAAMTGERSKCYKGLPELWSAVLFGNPMPGRAKPWVPVHGRNPDTWQAQNHMGAILYGEGQVDLAMGFFKRAVELKPYNCEVHNNYALTLNAKGRTEEALVHFKRAAELKADATILANYGDALLKADRPAEAAEQFEKSLKIKPNNPPLWLMLGNAHLMMHQHEKAIAAYLKALELNPNYAEARHNIEFVAQKLRERESASEPSKADAAPETPAAKTPAPQDLVP